ncbi:hypothetical protein GobsT_17430 [Gemmata obscuriglobus]|uniref:DUF4392 domain-containing protein n=1 Tax=Gemmata obscuriglobus TaxID=114 RepID=A0A2Z3H1I2_9BACT|nr:DUF4392 domain-containing protein [Gemmata obscuriglobus]AWM39883.1 DUF4392 domain-containing protein [Gemmata obscuriglobus]QEG26991.1 hypothetical protein GobsT_17430 [Gemmata obscuriglobus]VTS03263.1 Putative uncharacterized protein OS=Moorea producens 3L GN=LYNGBM3L_08880 PE=4 SV=1: DUF4392 [Gemmata obscuriglobus UQM 2246]
MTTDEKLTAILAAVQTDPGNRGLGRDPNDNLFTATKGDFEAACRSFVGTPNAALDVTTGFYIPTATPPAFETDGPLGAAFLFRALVPLGYRVGLTGQKACVSAMHAAIAQGTTLKPAYIEYRDESDQPSYVVQLDEAWPGQSATHYLAIEHVGRASNGRYYSMRGRDITGFTKPVDEGFLRNAEQRLVETIGIGDGGNEIGMGKIPHDTIVKNIPNGDLIHCRVPTDHLIVCGVSNWGAYAFAAGVYVLRGVTPHGDLFDPNCERKILEIMVREGPLVDGVTGQQTATVDGLTWDKYVKPLARIREILES